MKNKNTISHFQMNKNTHYMRYYEIY